MRTDRLLVIDVEATCWQGHPPPGEQHEIIEIGLCVFDLRTFQAGETRSLLIKPQRSRISAFCTALTSITPDMVAQGMIFNEACGLLRREYDSCDLAWASWGKDDRRLFERQCASFEVQYPFSKRHIDLWRLFARLQRENRSVKLRHVGLARALALMGLNGEGTAHRGVNDAFNTARLLAALFEQYGPDILER